MDLKALNKAHAIEGHIRFEVGEGGFIYARIANARGTASVCTYGGHVLSYRPTDGPAEGASEGGAEAPGLLFVSREAGFVSGKAIRGGVPVCWPWFGPDPEKRGRPSHGLARTRQWAVRETSALNSACTRLVLSLSSDADTRELWPHAFELSLEVTVGAELGLTLTTTNRGDQSFTLSQALHAYFTVADVRDVRVLGLERHDYIDQLDGHAVKRQRGAVIFKREVDRIYTGVDAPLVIDDPGLKRRIGISGEGSRSAVVWNPWVDKAAALGDFGDDEY
ncbi:MAG: D-hexose-6-phosphate mutarotase, partial [Gammaproteobacteria bacterium]